MTTRVTYQAMLAGGGGPGAGRRYVPLGSGSIATRGKDARADLTVRVSREQLRWLGEVEAGAGGGIDAGVVVRALVDLGRELDVDWAMVRKGSEVRDAVRRSVLVSRPAVLPEG